MAATLEELDLIAKAAVMAQSLLPELKREQAILADRIRWHESNIAAWEAIREKPQQRSFTVKGVSIPSQRAGRGEAQDRILLIMQSHPEYKAKDIQKELTRQNGLTYGLSTIYRVMEMVEKEKSKTPA